MAQSFPIHSLSPRVAQRNKSPSQRRDRLIGRQTTRSTREMWADATDTTAQGLTARFQGPGALEFLDKTAYGIPQSICSLALEAGIQFIRFKRIIPSIVIEHAVQINLHFLSLCPRQDNGILFAVCFWKSERALLQSIYVDDLVGWINNPIFRHSIFLVQIHCPRRINLSARDTRGNFACFSTMTTVLRPNWMMSLDGYEKGVS